MMSSHFSHHEHTPAQISLQYLLQYLLHIIGIEQVQTGSDPFRHVKHPRSATATERT